MLYYLLHEPFSAFSGLAIARGVANMMRAEPDSIVVCPAADDTWQFPPDRIQKVPRLALLARVRGWMLIPPPLRTLLVTTVYKAFLRNLQPGDVVWCHNWPYIAEALQPSIQSRGAKLVLQAHNSLARYAAHSRLRTLPPDALVFVSEAMREEVLHRLPPGANTYAIHNGADETLFYPRPVGASPANPVPVVLYVGRLTSVKGVHILLRAMQLLEQRKIKAVCRIIGSAAAGGSRETPYVRSLRQASPPSVHFAGFRAATEIAAEYRSADIFCCPSIWPEPFGNTNIEAMACGLPVVASRVGAIPVIAAEGGIVLVEPGSPVELADALQRLIEDRDLRHSLAAEGLRSFHRRFTWNIINQQYRDVLLSLGSPSPAPPSTTSAPPGDSD